MKLCPLFQKLRDKAWCHISTLEHVQRELPREAIEAAIEEVEYSAEVTLSESRQKYLAKVVEQLRAMLPQDHADLTASDSELHGGGMDE